MKKSKFIRIGFLVLLAIMGYLFFGIYHKSAPDIVEAETEVRISSRNLVSSFLVDEFSANRRYVEKTIEVSGVVKEVNFLNDRYTLFLDGGDTFACLMCDMNSDQLEGIEQITPGQSVRIKGICKGFLVDAILLNCVLLQ